MSDSEYHTKGIIHENSRYAARLYCSVVVEQLIARATTCSVDNLYQDTGRRASQAIFVPATWPTPGVDALLAAQPKRSCTLPRTPWSASPCKTLSLFGRKHHQRPQPAAKRVEHNVRGSSFVNSQFV